MLNAVSPVIIWGELWRYQESHPLTCLPSYWIVSIVTLEGPFFSEGQSNLHCYCTLIHVCNVTNICISPHKHPQKLPHKHNTNAQVQIYTHNIQCNSVYVCVCMCVCVHVCVCGDSLTIPQEWSVSCTLLGTNSTAILS